MAKCKFCGETYPDNSRFCLNCGKPVADKDVSAATAALEEAQKEFDKDALATLDRSRMTFVCSICGTVNSIDSAKCSCCGKPRPRSEFVNAIKKIQESEAYKAEMAKAQAEAVVEPAPAEEVAPEAPIEEAVQEPVQETAAPVQQYANMPTMQTMVYQGGQAQAVVQPFVVVPYVNPNQRLWQYNPNQVYRFEEYTDEEKRAIEEQKRLVAEREAEILRQQQEAMMQAYATEESKASAVEKTEAPAKPAKAGGVRAVAVLNMLFSIAFLVVAYVLDLVDRQIMGITFESSSVMYYVMGIAFCLKGIGLDINFENSAYEYNGFVDFIAPVAFMIAIICAVILIIRSLVRLISGKATSKGWFLNAVFFVAIIVGFVGVYLHHHVNELADFVDALEIGAYAIAAVALITFIVGLCGPKNAIKEPKAKK